MQNKNSDFKGKINNKSKLRQFVKYFLYNLQSEATGLEILDYAKEHGFEDENKYPLSTVKITRNALTDDEIESCGKQCEKINGTYTHHTLFRLKDHPCTHPYKLQWTKKITGKTQLREFIRWYLRVQVQSATTIDMMDYITRRNLKSRNYSLDASRISRNIRVMTDIVDSGEKKRIRTYYNGALRYKYYVLWTLKENFENSIAHSNTNAHALKIEGGN